MNRRDLILHDGEVIFLHLFYLLPSLSLFLYTFSSFLYVGTHSPAVLLLKTDATQHKKEKKKDQRNVI